MCGSSHPNTPMKHRVSTVRPVATLLSNKTAGVTIRIAETTTSRVNGRFGLPAPLTELTSVLNA